MKVNFPELNSFGVTANEVRECADEGFVSEALDPLKGTFLLTRFY